MHHSAPRVALAFHADTEFTPRERQIIAASIEALEYQTAGMYDIGIVYDLDFEQDISKFSGTPWLVRALSTYPWIQMFEAASGDESKILGLTLREPPTAPPQVYLVIDRLENDGRMKNVTMHELLHAAGLEHVGGPNSVMSAAVCYQSGGQLVCPNTTCMSPSDAAEFCRVQKCKPQGLNYCDWPG